MPQTNRRLGYKDRQWSLVRQPANWSDWSGTRTRPTRLLASCRNSHGASPAIHRSLIGIRHTVLCRRSTGRVELRRRSVDDWSRLGSSSEVHVGTPWCSRADWLMRLFRLSTHLSRTIYRSLDASFPARHRSLSRRYYCRSIGSLSLPPPVSVTSPPTRPTNAIWNAVLDCLRRYFHSKSGGFYCTISSPTLFNHVFPMRTNSKIPPNSTKSSSGTR